MAQVLPHPTVLVRLSMRSESDGGRHGAFTEGYSPHFVVAGHSEWLSVRVVSCPHPVGPGDTVSVSFELLYYPNVDYSALRPGCQFMVHEGPRAVAEGVVLSVSGLD